MFIHESLASTLGLPFVVVVLAIVAVVALMWIMRYLDVPNSACNQDCNQGRNCTCKLPAMECAAWPFPCDKQCDKHCEKEQK